MSNPDGMIQSQIRLLTEIVEVLEGARPVSSLIPPPEFRLYLPDSPKSENATGNYIICGRAIAWCNAVLRGDLQLANRAFQPLMSAIGGQRKRGWMSIEGRFCEQNAPTPHGEFWLAGVAVARAVGKVVSDSTVYHQIYRGQALEIMRETDWWFGSLAHIGDVCSVKGRIYLPGLNYRIKEPKPGVWTGFQMANDIMRKGRRVLRPNQREDPLFVGVRAMEWSLSRGDNFWKDHPVKSMPYMIHPMEISRLSSSHLVASIEKGQEKVVEKWVLDSLEVKDGVFRGSKGWKNPIQHPEGAARVVTPREA